MICNRYRTSSKISRAPSVTGIGTVFSGGSLRQRRGYLGPAGAEDQRRRVRAYELRGGRVAPLLDLAGMAGSTPTSYKPWALGRVRSIPSKSRHLLAPTGTFLIINQQVPATYYHIKYPPRIYTAQTRHDLAETRHSFSFLFSVLSLRASREMFWIGWLWRSAKIPSHLSGFWQFDSVPKDWPDCCCLLSV